MIYITKERISFADGVHEQGEAIELDSLEAQARLGIATVDIERLITHGAIELQVIITPLVLELSIDTELVAPLTDKPAKVSK